MSDVNGERLARIEILAEGLHKKFDLLMERMQAGFDGIGAMNKVAHGQSGADGKADFGDVSVPARSVPEDGS